MGDRRGYNPSDYVPSNEYPADEGRGRSADPYGDSTESYRYRRSTYESSPNDKQLTRDPYYAGNSRGSGGGSGYYDEGYDDRRLEPYDSRNEGRSRSRRAKSRNRSQSGKSERYDERSRSGSGERPIEGRFGKEKKDIAATAIGVVAGAFLGHEAGKKHGHAATIGGALLGGLAANAIEHQHLKRQQERRLEKQYNYDDDYDDDRYDRRGGR